MKTVRIWTTDEVLQAYFEALQEVLHGQGVRTTPDFFAFPLVIYTPVGVSLVRDPQQFHSIVAQYRQALSSRGVVKTELRVEGQVTLSEHRVRATVRYIDLSGDGRVVANTVAQYFLMRHGESYRVEMLEYLELPLPLSVLERIVH